MQFHHTNMVWADYAIANWCRSTGDRCTGIWIIVKKKLGKPPGRLERNDIYGTGFHLVIEIIDTFLQVPTYTHIHRYNIGVVVYNKIHGHRVIYEDFCGVPWTFRKRERVYTWGFPFLGYIGLGESGVRVTERNRPTSIAFTNGQ